MKCPNCKINIPEDSIFCEFCGTKVNDDAIVKEPAIPGEERKIKKEPELEKVITHLEFLGYEVSEHDVEGKLTILAIHNSKNNLRINYSANGISVISIFTINPESTKKNKDKVYEVINLMNNQALLISYSISDDFSSLICGSWYPSNYEKATFSDFLELYNSDIQNRLNQTDFIKLTE